MSKSKMSIAAWVIVIVLIIIWSISGILNIRKNKEPYSVSVIVDDSFNDRWLVARKGLEQAAKENNIIMNYVFTNKFETVEQQMEVINREITNGADGIIIQWISSDVNVEELTRVMKDKAIVMLEADIFTEGMYHVCSVDNYELGKSAANRIMKGKKTFDEVSIGVFAGNEKLVSTKEQLEGLQNVFHENETEEKWIIYNNDQNAKDRLEQKLRDERVDIVLFLGSTQTELGIDCLEQNEGLKTEAYGAGYSPKSVYYLDKQVLKSLVVPEEFNLGYQSMQALAEQLKYHANGFMKTEIGFRTVDCEQIHEKDNEKILFPIVQ